MVTFESDTQDQPRVVIGIILAGLAMSVGWGFRGDYGHEAGAMVPGALLGLAICIGSGRADWWRRAAIMGMCGAIGWAFGGQMSYAKITGYTAGSSLLEAFYGYACLFLIGGIGFVLGDFLNMLGRAQWGPVGRYEVLHDLDYWKWMEQSFGLIMGLGVGATFLRHVRASLSAPPEDSRGKRLGIVSLLLLLIVMMWLNLSKNFSNWAGGKHIPPSVLGIGSVSWLLGIGVLLSAVAAVAIIRQHRARLAVCPAGDFGRAQMLFMIVLWIPVTGAFTQALPGLSGRGVFLVQASFLITAGLCSLIVVGLKESTGSGPVEPRGPSDKAWRLGWRFWACLGLVPLLLYVTAYLTIASHDGPLPYSQVRFSRPPAAEPAPTRP